MSGAKKFMIPRGHGKSRIATEFLIGRLRESIKAKPLLGLSDDDIFLQGYRSNQASDAINALQIIIGDNK